MTGKFVYIGFRRDHSFRFLGQISVRNLTHLMDEALPEKNIEWVLKNAKEAEEPKEHFRGLSCS